MKELIDKLTKELTLTKPEFIKLLSSDFDDGYLYKKADEIRKAHYGNKVYIRGLIEFSNYCKNNCYYCGIRAGNKEAVRYRLTKDEILECCREGYILGFRTFVLQSGEDLTFTDKDICDIVYSIKQQHPDCAVTLSIGEKSRQSYSDYRNAGADRYLLRHETATDEHYSLLHPESMSLENRKRCLFDLKELGYQVGSGFMVGSPYQTVENIVEDLYFLKHLQPDMIGIGPFLRHEKTPFSNFPNGSYEMTLRLISVLRLMFPYALIPSTTALGTINQNGREAGIKAGANVVMPNLSPLRVRKLYMLYENKISTGDEAAESLASLKRNMSAIGYNIVTDVGNVKR